MTIALGAVKSGTVSGFYNVALVISFLTDVFYFKMILVWSDYVGALVIIISTCFQGYISNQDNEASKKAQESYKFQSEQEDLVGDLSVQAYQSPKPIDRSRMQMDFIYEEPELNDQSIDQGEEQQNTSLADTGVKLSTRS